MKQEIISLNKLTQNKLTSRTYKKICTTLIYIEQFLNLASTITGCISISAFASLLDIPIGNYKFCNRINNLSNNCRNQKM